MTFDQINHAPSAWPMQHFNGRWVANVRTSRKNMLAANVTAFEDGGTIGVLDKIPDVGSRNHGRLGEVVPASGGHAADAVDFRVYCKDVQ